MSDIRVIAGGMVYMDRWDSTGAPQGERYVGSSKAVPFNQAPETIADYANETVGIGEKADETTTKIDRNFTLELSSIDAENLALAMLGETSLYTAPGATHTAEPIDNVTPGLEYQLPSASRPQGARKVSGVSVQDDAGTPVTFVLDTDYTLDAVTGRIKPLTTGSITKGTNLRIDYTEDAASWQVLIGSGVQVLAGLRILGATSKGPVRDWYFPKCNITPDGEFLIKGDPESPAYQRIRLKVEVLKRDNNTAPFYVDDRPAAA